MSRKAWWLAGIVALVVAIGVLIVPKRRARSDESGAESPRSRTVEAPKVPTAAERILEGYGDPAAPPVEDVRMIHRIASAYFSVIKDGSRHPIGGNADFAAALRGENPNREVFLRADHPVFREGLLVDRWGTPLVVHPEGWRSLEIRSAGPDRKPYTEDDLVVLPTGLQPENRR